MNFWKGENLPTTLEPDLRFPFFICRSFGFLRSLSSDTEKVWMINKSIKWLHVLKKSFKNYVATNLIKVDIVSTNKSGKSIPEKIQ